jgi:hypothetical protein
MDTMRESEVAAYVCSHVFARTRPVLLVVRDRGDWQLLCGGVHDPEDLPEVVGLNHLIDDDPSLRQIIDLPVDWEAERQSPDEPWIRTPCQPAQ